MKIVWRTSCNHSNIVRGIGPNIGPLRGPNALCFLTEWYWEFKYGKYCGIGNLFRIYKGITLYIPFKLAGNVLSGWQLDIRLILNIHIFISFSISTTNAINSLNNKAPFLCSGLQRPFQSHQHQSNHRQQGVMALLPAERCFSRSRDTRPSSDVFCWFQDLFVVLLSGVETAPIAGETASPPLNHVGPNHACSRRFWLYDEVRTLALARGPFTNGFCAFDKLFYYRNSIGSYRGHTEIARMFARRSFVSTKRSQSLLGCGLPTFHVVFQESNIKRVEIGDKLQ